ncbi:MAG: primosomal protein N', partial [Acidobacteriota bacterium]|nr:primosomal protein N' [Acidobacteriota bacterium]
MPVFCEVALPVPLNRTFTYSVPDGQVAGRGVRVIAPFRQEKLIGVVTVCPVEAPVDFEARPIEAVIDEEPLLSEHLLRLGEWIAQYYLAPLGEVLRGMLPLTAEVRRTVYYRITDLGRDALASAVEREASAPRTPAGSRKTSAEAELADEHSLVRRVLTRLAAGEAVRVSALRTATSATLPVLVSMVRRKWIARETSAVERDARRTVRFAMLVAEARLPALTEKQQAVLAELAACGGEMPLAVLRRKNLPTSTLQTLVRRGLVRIDERAVAFHLGGIAASSEPVRLNELQVDALASVAAALGGFKPFLLRG